MLEESLPVETGVLEWHLGPHLVMCLQRESIF